MTRSFLAATIATALFVAVLFSGLARGSDDPNAAIARGRYLVGFGSCNDCHTPHWRESDGTVPVSAWMTGTRLGYRGPWGTSYPANVRLEFATVSEEQWLFMVRTRAGHWPMVWHDLRLLDIDDQRAIYRFIKSLGVAGSQAPPGLAPSVNPSTPYVWVVPHDKENLVKPHSVELHGRFTGAR